MAGTTELENLVVRLTGDGEQYARMLLKAMEETKNLDNTVKQLDQTQQEAANITRQFMTAEERFSETQDNLNRLLREGAITTETYERAMNAARPTVEAVGRSTDSLGDKFEDFTRKVTALAKATAEFSFLKSSFDAFSGREQVMIRLNSALEVNGRAVQSTTADYKAWAKEISHVSMSSSGEITTLLAKAEAYELTGEKAKKAVQGALAIAAVNDTEANSLLRVTAAIAKGDLEQAMGMARLVPELRGVKNETEFLSKVNKLTEVGMKTLEAQAKSNEGAVHHLSIVWKQFKGDLGEYVADGAKPAIEFTTGLLTILRAMPGPMKELVVISIALSAAWTAISLIGPFIVAALGSVYASMVAFGVAIAANPLTAWIVVIGLAAAALYGLGKVVQGELSAVKDMNRELEISAKLRNDLTTNQDRTTAQTLGQAAKIKDPDKKYNFLEDSLKMAEKEAKGYEREIKNVNKQMEVYNSFWRATPDLGKNTWGVMNQELVQNQQLLDGSKKRVQALKDEIAKLNDQELQDDIDEIVEKMYEELALIGKTAEEQERYRLKAREATEGQLKEFDAIANKLANKKHYQEIEDAVYKVNEALQEQIETYGMTADQIEIYKLKSLGASNAQVQLTKDLQEQKAALEKQQDLYDKGQEVVEKFLTPQTKFMVNQRELSHLLEEGAIDVGTYERAMRQARKEIEGAAAAQKDFVETGSAESNSRIRQYLESNFSPSDPVSGKTYSPEQAPGVGSGSAEAASRIAKTNDILSQIREILKIQGQSNNPVISAANLEF